MKFIKMHGAGNDYVYVDCFQEHVPDPALLARKVSDRHFGIGGDGLVLICPSKICDAFMDMYNLDGSRGKMCGNASRCVGKYLYESGLCKRRHLTLETLSGVKHLTLYPDASDQVQSVEVDMGAPVLDACEIPCVFNESPVIAQPLTVAEEQFSVTCVSMGNPHCVVFVNQPDSFPVHELGPLFEHHPAFPEQVNTEFISVTDRKHIQMRVWERGSGETLACGTGACASVVACVLNGLTDREVEVRLPGGVLQIRWDSSTDHVIMRGPAVTVFTTEIPYEEVLKWSI